MTGTLFWRSVVKRGMWLPPALLYAAMDRDQRQ